MRLSVRGFALACALIWGIGVMLLVGLVHLARPEYGDALLKIAAAIYPGYTAEPNVGQLLLGVVYGVLDGAIGGAIFAWLYNLAVPAPSPPETT